MKAGLQLNDFPGWLGTRRTEVRPSTNIFYLYNAPSAARHAYTFLQNVPPPYTPATRFFWHSREQFPPQLPPHFL